MSETQKRTCIERLMRAQTEFKNAIDGVKKAGGDQRGAAIAHTHVDTAGLWARMAADGIPVEAMPVMPTPAPVPLPEETTPPVPPLAPVIEELPPAAATGPAAPEDVGN